MVQQFVDGVGVGVDGLEKLDWAWPAGQTAPDNEVFFY